MTGGGTTTFASSVSLGTLTATGSGKIVGDKDVTASVASIQGNGSLAVNGSLNVADSLSLSSGNVNVNGMTSLGTAYPTGSSEVSFTLGEGGGTLSTLGGLSVNGVPASSADTVATMNGVHRPGDWFHSGAPGTGQNLNVTLCFLTGTLIETPTGPQAVETIRSGDSVMTLVADEMVAREVVWAGHAHTVVREGLPDDEAGYPVRVLKNAISDGMPSRDLLVTPEHALFLNGKLVPVRMLVNGSSIFYDRTITSYDYFHIETAEHAILVAEGAFTESYLDTGNRAAFREQGVVVRLRGSSSASILAAPLDTDRAFVEPIFRAIAERASGVEGHREASSAVATVAESGLHLVMDDGEILEPVRRLADRVSFNLPSGTQRIRLVSRASRPSDVVGPFVDDRRELGVLIGEVVVTQGGTTREVSGHLVRTPLPGWHGVESNGACRWTNGNAVLVLEAPTKGDAAFLDVQVLAGGPYLAPIESSVRLSA
ncbi:hypothetical protein AA0472_0841 [Acetobacter estunensis NRIC 0472]|uniref:Hedgehog/Intein (Hint) domain-containing protein n=1 Tax=Acetobacter estunensis TaxID=104097 RepID=A0A967B4B6_9PROT|nr:Hint domain-containing protein [Acetobacter estunensis]NHO52605.1 hypothetical protein [Acetobacter estunensis]GBQ22675.1 hypothetical protein AA0472_0841 [Acetobacter estunensis NRIC 0472]